MTRNALLLVPALAMTAGLFGCVIDTSRAGLTKAEARAQLEDEPPSSNWDPCAEEGWYGDAVCDDWCPQADPDCGDPPPPSERACGGLLGLTCTDHEYCDFADDALCGAADQTGICRPRPEVCPEIYGPVCGCDGRTYSNDCEAHGNGVDDVRPGACDDPTPPPPPPTGTVCGGFPGFACAADEFCDYADDALCGAADATGICVKRPETWTEIYAPVCGCDGRTYSNQGEANGIGGTDVAHIGECDEPTDPPPPPPPTGTICGGFPGFACGADEFCDYEPADICGAADATGVCRPRPEVCPELYAPVCGCDGVTYGNACEAHGNGIDDATPGECERG